MRGLPGALRLWPIRFAAAGLALLLLTGLAGRREGPALAKSAEALGRLEWAVAAGRWAEAGAVVPSVELAFQAEVLPLFQAGGQPGRTTWEEAFGSLPGALERRDLKGTLGGLRALREALKAARRR